jgi:hypothetical protein
MKPQKTKLDLLFSFADKIARTSFKKYGAVATGWLCETDDGNKFVLYTPWPDRKSKIAHDAYLRQLFFEKGVVRYVFVAESWLLDDTATSGGPPERREVIMLIGEDRDTEEVLTRLRYILRPTNGAATLSPRVSDTKGDRPSGHFCNMFERELREPTRH